MSERPDTLRSGYRGYIGSRPVLGSRTPQHVQNLVIRDYAARSGLTFKLSATEYAMPHCYMMLEQVLAELPGLDGMIAYSLFMLPERRDRRREVYRRILDAGASLHTAVEGLVLAGEADIGRLEDIWSVQQALTHMAPVRF
ncbi:sporadic carbohydrate cluster protein (TIGR04323 family) [Azospirillum brasilense]|uniref:Sporadic carbohydrate cluster protein (TIGR04323 family) n=1 Tax=Azospirillum brasilense TaxID=192 RepID=A0A560AL29_AZOBR|nr:MULTISPECIES: LIC12192 family sporadic carbohydrate cluster protein [Azospirillum]NUB05052.1 sporadic carbohydrate cluster protein, TIGR04323 family [Azospirillum baldaniorum]TWA61046.1 sporadic carbohydrate cluster protein (TIGR04323 family) [Azospirillum brasilense]